VTESDGSISARMEVFANSVQAASALDEGFKQANGFEAQIFLRQVSAAQCAVVDFLDRVGAASQNSPQLAIAADRLRAGESLKGTVSAAEGRHVELLLVSPEGLVENVSVEAQGSPEGAFDIPLDEAGTPEPQLLVALTTAEPLVLPSESLPAATYFPQVLAQAERSGDDLGVAVKYFKAGG
jgi:serine/threonine-protein kinase